MKNLSVNLLAEDSLLAGAQLLTDNLHITLCGGGTPIRAVCGDALEVQRTEEGYTVTYSTKSEFFRGLAICVHAIRTGEFSPVRETRNFSLCGIMLDMSRNSVYTADTVREYLRYMALMGLNMLMLYTEDTYEIEEYPMFGFGRGKYTKAELKELDRYALTLGIELIPCIQTLSHLATTLRWKYTSKFRSTGSTLYVGKEETYEFIDTMLKSVRECFSTDRIHIGLDEAGDISVGRGILKERGYVEPFTLMSEHVRAVCGLCAKYGLKPMMWSDMFFKNGVRGGDYDRTSVIPEDAAKQIPENIEMVYWDYCYENGEETDFFIKRHREALGRNVIFAGGIWTWNRLVPSFVKTFDTANSQLKSCKEHGVREVFATVWANTCAAFDFSILPGIQMYAEHMYNREVTDKQLSRMFAACTGCKLEDFLCLGLDDFTHEELEKYREPGMFCINSSAQIFFNDVLLGLYDKTLSGYDFGAHYGKYLAELKKRTDMGKFEPLFRQTELLAEILVNKSGIGTEITAAYKAGSRDTLAALLLRLENLLSLYERYHDAAYRRWMEINKPFGWEGIDMLLGGAEARLRSAVRRIRDYLDGRCDRIEELEEERVFFNGQENPLTESGQFTKIMTLCSFS